ncbi:UDP-N-acetylglucosamine--N-acetylmuramyl-(pentapeptide) pyrophosphoryl-undecaprenol N-acetylglucosamine transferase [Glaciecola punicea ACAM 611]|jgi:UDP-N-acetylglucosamine--N-acetylmuramyl-(pentapeptide) pyrophosphoryl-undecaprenol N-acetylglucosamine transferase|uniref:UDP-N-acetylglucosamine--N-acetylmuramyl-(pentapeptide) pyrophosphoryl-undecaprenol N-acetylglucosamine transferase n=1 Tax=Glaciecola punicea ACAM 611 TaxID=1121923 RepID=H5TDL4_9ALTE|nr:undecaprenyldiphospho-muramoylpentapeptide beta-N-acetylglucosaminyltransferase [Glaciecola punicea]OFA32427.1 undecaprenyldiphospho-muramoylpentapeptide beta-N-acetylglucosaminyltransferase [Glaciecola punicea]GAB56391.1 UDP-N-acetylglucosamine--N-acetylmuramyl-(pentapeptide) pyrophosphoryl-undecaprenol N-acetylglucosamine transferase [Glaciecola punicea ACAM 611]
MNKCSLVIMAGGTGGHVFPGLAVASLMREKGWQVEWIGTADKMEAQLVPKYGFNIHFINIGGLRGKSIITQLLTPFKLAGALFQSIALLRKLRPSAVLGMGGYASGPGGIAAWLLKVPLVVHEQNAVFGMTNRYLAKIATFTLTGFDLASVVPANAANKSSPSNTHYVGNPIRQDFFDIAPKHRANSTQSLNILIVGGSLGALALNQIVPKVLITLGKRFSVSVMHQSGANKHAQVQAAYQNMPNVEVIEFIDNMQSAFSWSDIIICRAGALTVAEVAGAGRVAIFVPLPNAVDDHQSANARYLSDKGGALLIQQSALETSLLPALETVCLSLEKRDEIASIARASAHKNATFEVASFIEKAVNANMQNKNNKRD